jgi:hypothetical protein
MRAALPILAVCLVALILHTTNTFAAEHERSPRVEQYLQDANTAMEHLANSDLAAVEQVLTPGFEEIEDMVETYVFSSDKHSRINTYLRERGWGQLVWTQIMVRLLAVRNGVCDRELEFAARVAMERIARESLDTVETSMARVNVLLEAKALFGFSDEVDAFAQGLFPDSDETKGYQVLLSDYQDRFTAHRKTVIARLESGRIPGVVDPSVLPSGTRFAETYEHHHERLQSEDTRLDEIFTRLAEYDHDQVAHLVAISDAVASTDERNAVLNQARMELLLFEDALGASESDPVVQHMLDVCERQESNVLAQQAHGDVDFQDAMILINSAQQTLGDQANAGALRNFYALGDLAR